MRNIKSLIILTTILGIVIFNSCTRDEQNPSLESEQLKIGEMHNKLLTDFYANNPDFKNSNYSIATVIDEMENIFDLNYPNLKEKYNDINIKSFYHNINARTSDYDLVNHIDQLGQQLVDDGVFNEDLFLFIKDIAINKPTYDEMLISLEVFKNSHSDLLESDNDFRTSVEVLEEIALYSNSYWDNNESSSTNREIDRCEQQGYIADIATGALLFWNPIGSIIGGAAASLIASENCQAGNP